MAQIEPDRIEITTAAALWDWLRANHAGPSVWLVTWKAACPEKYIGRDEVLDALLAHGWIDGRRMKLDAARTMQLIAPRSQKVWARSYKDRAERLIAEGRMQPSGMAAYRQAQLSSDWPASDPIDDLVVPADLRAALECAAASAWFDASAPSYRRNVLRYLSQARRDDTRRKRIARITDHAARGEKVPQY